MDRPICDKCGGVEFEIVSTDPLPKLNDIPASRFFSSAGQVTAIPAIMIYHHYKATCKKCGAEYKYSQ